MGHLVSYKYQIEPNLRRTASNGLISLLNHQQLEDLAFNYFGIKDEYGNIIGYQCPYSGKIYTDYKDIVLEHIVPVASKGGTVLFNCIPTSKEVNGADQKGAKHLIHWWTSSNYWNQDAPRRLEKILNYMLDGYEQVFKEYTIEEVESSYLDIETDEGILDEEEDKNLNARAENKLLKQAKNNGIHSYLGFIYDCINTLEKCNINTSTIKERIQQLQNQNIFKDIDKYQLYQNIIQKLVVSRIGDNNSSYLTYTLNFDIKKLMDSINLDNEQYIYNELNRRLQNIEQLLKENNLSTIEYFKSLKDIQDIDIIYKNNVSSEEIKTFLENIKLGLDTKIDIFIEMLNEGNDRILKRRNTETLKEYASISLSQFWNQNQHKIKQKLFIVLKDNPEYDTARKTILKYYEVANYEELVTKQKLESERRALGIENQIEIFIEMLNEGNDQILKQRNKENLKGYPSISLYQFWNKNKSKIKQKLFVELKDDYEYNVARQTVLTYFKASSYEELVTKQKLESERRALGIENQIEIFIEMLNEGNSNILKAKNKETLEGYPNINLSQFWNMHKDRIKQKLFVELKDISEYNVARQIVLTYFKASSYEELVTKPKLDYKRSGLEIKTQIELFIEMLNEGNDRILKQENTETLKGYPSISLSYFWQSNKSKIEQKLFVELKDNPEYDTARKTILKYYEVSNYEELVTKQKTKLERRELGTKTQIEIFIEMLNEGNDRILKQRNTETLKGYSSISLSSFWQTYKSKIEQKLFVELKDNPEYDTARKTILKYYEVSNYEELVTKQKLESERRELGTKNQIEIFIEMLNEGNDRILKKRNTETLKGYPRIRLSQFWSTYKTKIKQKLFIELKNKTEYNIARQTVLTYFKVSSYEELEAKQNKGKKLQELEQMQQELIESIEYIDKVDLTEQRKRA